MELDDLKSAWEDLGRKVERQTALSLRAFRQGEAEKARRGLRPLIWGQGLQMAAGVLLSLISVLVWSRHPRTPDLLFAGLLMHAYGLVLILFSARVQALLNRIDFTAPVLDIQRDLAKLRRFYVVGGLWLGLPWWLLWMPMAMVAFGLLGVDIAAGLCARAPLAVALILGVNAAGLLATFAFIRWSARRPDLARRLERSAAGGTLNRAQAMLDDIARFEEA